MNHESVCQFNIDEKENQMSQFNSNSQISGTIKIQPKYEYDSNETLKQNGFDGINK